MSYFYRRVLRKCNKSKMKLLKQDIELLVHPMGKMGNYKYSIVYPDKLDIALLGWVVQKPINSNPG